MIYAIGEIALVMIGILLALQVNNWKNDRQDKKQEDQIMKGLFEDFSKNIKEIRKAKEINDIGIVSTIKTIQLIGQDESKAIGYNTDSLIFAALNYSHFSASENALKDLINSGRLHLLKNDHLKNYLYNWSIQIRSVELKHEGWQHNIDNRLIPYLMTRYPFRDISDYDLLDTQYDYGKSEIEVDKLQIFKDLEFENLLDDLIFRVKSYQDELRKIEQTAESIITEAKID